MGEDSFIIRGGGRGDLLCVADGCGGLGSRRYQELDQKTGAYLASRLITRIAGEWAEQIVCLPKEPDSGRAEAELLTSRLQETLTKYARRNGMLHNNPRIVGSMQRILPSTLCLALTERQEENESCCFLWAGDSRGYQLTLSGLHQYTQDDLRCGMDAFDCLYCDSSLSNCVSVDQPFEIHMRRILLTLPSVLLCATDGAYNCLPTPMEFEMLLLSTMQAASDAETWKSNMEKALHKLASDDATLACRPRGFADFAEMKRYYLPRLQELRGSYILPVRRKRQDRDFARECWRQYRTDYDCTGGTCDEQDDWRI